MLYYDGMFLCPSHTHCSQGRWTHSRCAIHLHSIASTGKTSGFQVVLSLVSVHPTHVLATDNEEDLETMPVLVCAPLEFVLCAKNNCNGDLRLYAKRHPPESVWDTTSTMNAFL